MPLLYQFSALQQELGRKDVITWRERGNNLKRRGD